MAAKTMPTLFALSAERVMGGHGLFAVDDAVTISTRQPAWPLGPFQSTVVSTFLTGRMNPSSPSTTSA